MLRSILVLLLAALCLYVPISALAGNNSGQAFATWPDTGQTTCYDGAGNVLDPCPAEGQPFHGQDAQYAGPARSYTKLDSSGNALSDSAPSWAMVRDNVTGLVWEVKEAFDGVENYSNPRDADNWYTWCDTNTATNGGDQGYCGASYNDTEDFLSALNGTMFGGHSDWRLPTIKELKTLVDRSRYYPAIFTTYFLDTVSSSYWSSTTLARSMNDAWLMHFSFGNDYGNEGWGIKYKSYYVRAVRGGQVSPEERFIANGDTVLDTVTCLEWQQATADTNGDQIPDAMTWKNALAYAADLSLAGHTDWRLPDYNELTSMVDYSRYNRATDTTAFPDSVSSLYWSSTTYANASSGAWLVNFYDGNDYYDVKSISYYVRAVRGVQCGIFVYPQPRPEPIIDPGIVGIDRNAVVLTHGWNSNVEKWAINDSTYTGLADEICKDLNPSVTLNQKGGEQNTRDGCKGSYNDCMALRCSTDNWDVFVYDWRTAAGQSDPMTAFDKAYGQGDALAALLGAKKYSHIHLIGHSDGANLIERAKYVLKFNWPTTHLHLTFLDAADFTFREECGEQRSEFGMGADWVDNYVDTRIVADRDLDATRPYMEYAYNVNVTLWDNREDGPDPIADLLLADLRHGWPIDFYKNHTFSNGVDLGYQLSKESGNSFPPVNKANNKVCVLPPRQVSATPQCWTPPLSLCGQTPVHEQLFKLGATDAAMSSHVKSTTGSVSTSIDPVQGVTYWQLTTGSPVWSKWDFQLKKPANLMEFDYEFLSNVGAQGYLTIYVDNLVVGHSDERYSFAGKNTSPTFYLGELKPGKHTIAIRLDPYTATKSSIKLTNIKLINAPRGNSFPWPMFLPAIMGAGK